MEISQVLEALRNADAAGDKEAARRLAQIARQMMGDEEVEKPKAKPKEGLGAAVMKGLESYASQARTALTGPTEESARAGIARGEKISSEYAAQADPEKVSKRTKKKAYCLRLAKPPR